MAKDGGLTVFAPTVQCTVEAWDKLQAYSRCTIKSGETRRFVEISGYLIGKQLSPEEFLLTDALLVPSCGTAGTTEMDNDGTAKLLTKLAESDDEEDHELLRSMRGWWHVHPGTGGTFWSDQDKSQMEKFGEGGYDWLISVVLSHDGPGYRARIDFFRPYRIYVDNISIEIETEEQSELQLQVQTEVDENVTAPKVQVWKGGSGYRPGQVHGGGMPQTGTGFKGKVMDKRSSAKSNQIWETEVEKFKARRLALQKKQLAQISPPSTPKATKKGKKKVKKIGEVIQ